MDDITLFITIKLILTPFIAFIFSALFYYIYLLITDPHKIFFKSSNFKLILHFRSKKNNLSAFSKQNKITTFSILLSLSIIVLLYLIPFNYGLGFSNIIYDLVSIIFLLLIPSILIIIYSNKMILIQNPIKYVKGIFSLILSSVISIISLFLIIVYSSSNSSIIDFSTILNYQTNNVIQFLDIRLPALFVFLNPFAMISFFTCILGIIRHDRTLNHNINGKNHNKILFFAKQTNFFALICIFITLFFGGGFLFGQDLLLNVFSFLVFCLILTILISYLDFGKPKSYIEEKGKNNFKNKSFILSLLAIIYSFIILLIDFPFIELYIF